MVALPYTRTDSERLAPIFKQPYRRDAPSPEVDIAAPRPTIGEAEVHESRQDVNGLTRLGERRADKPSFERDVHAGCMLADEPFTQDRLVVHLDGATIAALHEAVRYVARGGIRDTGEPYQADVTRAEAVRIQALLQAWSLLLIHHRPDHTGE